ncbi:hypothetical protein H696_05952, partial [Fonticula alba]
MVLIHVHSPGVMDSPAASGRGLGHALAGVPLEQGQPVHLDNAQAGLIAHLVDHTGAAVRRGIITTADLATRQVLVSFLGPGGVADPPVLTVARARRPADTLAFLQPDIDPACTPGRLLVSQDTFARVAADLDIRPPGPVYLAQDRHFVLLRPDTGCTSPTRARLHPADAAALAPGGGPPPVLVPLAALQPLAAARLRVLPPAADACPAAIAGAFRARYAGCPLMLHETYPLDEDTHMVVEDLEWTGDLAGGPVGTLHAGTHVEVLVGPARSRAPADTVPQLYLQPAGPDAPLALRVDLLAGPPGPSPPPPPPAASTLAGRMLIAPDTYRLVRLVAEPRPEADVFLRAGDWYSLLCPDENPRSTLPPGWVRLAEADAPGLLPAGRSWARVQLTGPPPVALSAEVAVSLPDDPAPGLACGGIRHKELREHFLRQLRRPVFYVGQDMDVKIRGRRVTFRLTAMADRTFRGLVAGRIVASAVPDAPGTLLAFHPADGPADGPALAPASPASVLVQAPGVPAGCRLLFDTTPCSDRCPRGIGLLAPGTYRRLLARLDVPPRHRHYVRFGNRILLLLPDDHPTSDLLPGQMRVNLEDFPHPMAQSGMPLEWLDFREEVGFAKILVGFHAARRHTRVTNDKLRHILLTRFAQGEPHRTNVKYYIDTDEGTWMFFAKFQVSAENLAVRTGLFAPDRTRFYFESAQSTLTIADNPRTLVLTGRKRSGITLSMDVVFTNMPSVLYSGMRLPAGLARHLSGFDQFDSREYVFFRCGVKFFLVRLSDVHDDGNHIQVSQHFVEFLFQNNCSFARMESVIQPPVVRVARVRVTPVDGLLEACPLPQEALVRAFQGLFPDQTVVQYEKREFSHRGRRLLFTVEHLVSNTDAEISCGVFNPFSSQFLFRSQDPLVAITGG